MVKQQMGPSCHPGSFPVLQVLKKKKQQPPNCLENRLSEGCDRRPSSTSSADHLLPLEESFLRGGWEALLREPGDTCGAWGWGCPRLPPEERAGGCVLTDVMAGAFKGFIEVPGLGLRSQAAFFLGYGLREGEPEVVGRTKPACAGRESPRSCPSRADAASPAEGIPLLLY